MALRVSCIGFFLMCSTGSTRYVSKIFLQGAWYISKGYIPKTYLKGMFSQDISDVSPPQESGSILNTSTRCLEFIVCLWFTACR